MSARALATLAAATALAGCAALPPAPAGGWEAYRAQAAALRAWTLEGRVAVRRGGKGWSARLRWREAPAGWTLELRDPLGRRALRLRADGEGALLEAGGRREWAPDAGALLAHHAGLPVPVAALAWWVRGLPAPGTRHELALGPGGRPARIAQQGWTVRYLAYTEPAPGLVLPRRLELERGALRVRLVVDRWRPEEAARTG